MIGVICALYNEALPIVKVLGLRRSVGVVRGFRIFEGEDCVLGISGAGAMNAAILTAILLERYGNRIRCAVNFGSCGLTERGRKKMTIGDLVLCNGVYSSMHGARAYHPEILFNHTLQEARLITVDRPIDRDGDTALPELLSNFDAVDMEAYGFMWAAELFLPPSRTHVFKIPSDHLEPSAVTGQGLMALVQGQVERFISLLNEIRGQCRKKDRNAQDGASYRGWEGEILDDPRLSTSMRHRLNSLLAYARLNDMAAREVLKWQKALLLEKPGKEGVKAALRELEARLIRVPLRLESGE